MRDGMLLGPIGDPAADAIWTLEVLEFGLKNPGVAAEAVRDARAEYPDDEWAQLGFWFGYMRENLREIELSEDQSRSSLSRTS